VPLVVLEPLTVFHTVRTLGTNSALLGAVDVLVATGATVGLTVVVAVGATGDGAVVGATGVG
jgi:hypothetical protein